MINTRMKGIGFYTVDYEDGQPGYNTIIKKSVLI